ncbi:MAG: choice-of-anchor J domain-containing protein [Myxococcales bacterium]|nr:choice-of-anchor J domain-containing protein [Myxococcales bacterium]
MFRFTHGATPLVVGLLVLTGCPGDDVSIDTDGDTGTTTNNPTTTMGPAGPTTVDPDSGTDTGTDDGTTTDGPPPVCEPDCPAGQCCIGAPGQAGVCFDEPDPTCNPGCAATEICLFPDGADPCDPDTVAECITCGTDDESYAGCFADACAAGEECLNDDETAPTFGVCTPMDPCTDACDCPLPPGSGDAINACGDFGDGNRCYLDCSGGRTCPDGLACRTLSGNSICAEPDPSTPDCCLANGTPGCSDMMCQDTICALDAFCCSTEWDDICAGEADEFCQDPMNPTQTICGGPYMEPPPPEPLYGDCINGGMCDGGMGQTCLAGSDFGWCSIVGCADDMECQPAPPTGTAAATCQTFNDGMGGTFDACALLCNMGETCPDGMSCFMGSFCVWETLPPPGYDNCGLSDQVCGMGEVCLDDGDPMMMIDPTWAVCSDNTCADPSECGLQPPPTGNPTVTCGDPSGMGGPNTCYLGCAGGETCPDGMACTNNTLCAWPQGTSLFHDDFETGDFSMGWTTQDVDMQMVFADPSVSFVTAAWVASSVPDMGNFAATSTSWYDPAGTSDDWLISPQIMAGPNTRVYWMSRSFDGGFPDGFEMRVSTAGNTVADFVDAPVLTIPAENEAYTGHFVDLAASGYVNQPVYLAWRNVATDGWLLMVDEVTVVELP